MCRSCRPHRRYRSGLRTRRARYNGKKEFEEFKELQEFRRTSAASSLYRDSINRASAALTPPFWNGTPNRARPISTPQRVPHNIRSLKSPRWPIRKALPLSFPSPEPSDKSNVSSVSLRNSASSKPPGKNTAVRVLLYSSASEQTSSSHQKLTAA